jgi:hypothetical protein
LQLVLTKHQHVVDTPHVLPTSRGEHDHRISLVRVSQPPNVHPYQHPFSWKNEIEKIIKEILKDIVTCPNIGPNSSPIVMV